MTENGQNMFLFEQILKEFIMSVGFIHMDAKNGLMLSEILLQMKY